MRKKDERKIRRYLFHYQFTVIARMRERARTRSLKIINGIYVIMFRCFCFFFQSTLFHCFCLVQCWFLRMVFHVWSIHKKMKNKSNFESSTSKVFTKCSRITHSTVWMWILNDTERNSLSKSREKHLFCCLVALALAISSLSGRCFQNRFF